jgi:hypothetical protein
MGYDFFYEHSLKFKNHIKNSGRKPLHKAFNSGVKRLKLLYKINVSYLCDWLTNQIPNSVENSLW